MTEDGERVGKAVRQVFKIPARARLRQTAALIAGGVLLLTAVQTPDAQASGRAQTGAARSSAGEAATTGGRAPLAPAQPGTGGQTADIAITSLTPVAPTEDDTLTIAGTVTNRGKSTIIGSHVGIRVGGQPFGNRSDLIAATKRTAYVSADGPEVEGRTAALASIPAGVSRPFRIKVPVDDLGLGGNGVYQLGVSLLGQTRAAAFPQILGIERTFLPWYPDPEDTEQTEIALAWPLIGRPHMDARTDSDAQQTPIFRDDELTAELAPGGRLQQLVAIGKTLPVTWVIDPDLLATVDAMAKGYRVTEGGASEAEAAEAEAGADEGGATRNTRAGTGTDRAKAWLAELKEAVAAAPVVALPFADPDLASIAHEGRSVPGTLGHLKSATELASLTVDTVLGVQPRTDVAWPVEGVLDRSIVNVARASGADNVIASSASLGSGSLDHTPSSVRPIGGGTTALVADDALSRTFTGDLVRSGNSTLAVQRFLAETLMVTLESPHHQRSLLVAPQREPTASAAQAMAKALGAAQDRGWITPGTLADIESAKPTQGADRTVPGKGSYPGRLRKQELSTSAFRQIQATQTELQDFLVILSQEHRVVTPFGTAVLRSMSDSWRSDPTGALEYRDSLQDYLAGLKDLVHIVEKSPTTLSGSSGTLQVTVENNLAQEVTLKLYLASDLPYRFDIDKEENQQTVTIEGERKKTLKFPTSATANGRVSVAAQLYTLDGTPYGEEMRFQVNVTSVTGTVLVVIACGMLLLVLAGVRMYRQRKRTAPPADGAGGANEANEANDENDDNGESTESTDSTARTESAGGHGDAAGEPAPGGPADQGGLTADSPGHAAARTADQAGDPVPDTASGDPKPVIADEKVER